MQGDAGAAEDDAVVDGDVARLGATLELGAPGAKGDAVAEAVVVIVGDPVSVALALALLVALPVPLLSSHAPYRG